MVNEKVIWCDYNQKAVYKEDYLKVVEENKRLKLNNKRWKKISLKTKQKFTEELKDIIRQSHNSNYFKEQLEKSKDINDDLVMENKSLKNHIEVLTNLLKNDNEENTYKDESLALYYRGRMIYGIHPNNLENNLKALKDGKINFDWESIYNEEISNTEKEELWMLEYIYFDSKGNCKTVRLEPQPKEELFELIGMDSDNWIWFSMCEVK